MWEYQLPRNILITIIGFKLSSNRAISPFKLSEVNHKTHFCDGKEFTELIYSMYHNKMVLQTFWLLNCVGL